MSIYDSHSIPLPQSSERDSFEGQFPVFNAAILRVERSDLGITWRDWESTVLVCYICDEIWARTSLNSFRTSTMDIILLLIHTFPKKKMERTRIPRPSIQVKTVNTQQDEILSIRSTKSQF